MNAAPAPMRRAELLVWSLVRALLAAPVLAVILLASSSPSGLVWALALLMLAALFVRPWANLHRYWAGRVRGQPIPRPYLVSADHRWRARVPLALRDPATGRDLAWLLVSDTVGFALVGASVAVLAGALGGLILSVTWLWLPAQAHLWIGPVVAADRIGATIGMPAGLVGLLVGLPALALWWGLTPALMRADARLASALLAPTERARLAGRVRALTASRADTVDASAAELRRVERDLHDGPQARLIALGLNLGLAEKALARDPASAAELLAEARHASEQALIELRDVVRGIHPPVLADRGLAGAAQALALAQAVPVHVLVDLPERLPAPVEAAGYFAIAETLANAVRHSGAEQIWLVVRHAERRLLIVVEDDGHGGADPAAGSGLRGIQRRLAAFDGTLTLSSPIGGPTVVTMELPCALSSPRTTPSSVTG